MRMIPIRSVADKPPSIMGGDRRFVLTLMMGCSILIVACMKLVAAVVGGLLWYFGIKVFRKMYKSDPYLYSIYRRQSKFARYYPAQATPFRKK